MKRKYNENDEIEFRLVHNVADHYWLQWRFKEPCKFLFFNIKDKWKSLHYYIPGIFTPDDDPNDDFNWYWRGFHMGRENEVQEYDAIREKIKTKKALFDYYRVQDNIDLYHRHLNEHRQWVEKTNRNIDKYVK